MNHRGTLVVISGFSGVGKGTVTRQLTQEYGYSLSVSMTTRAPREGEVDGREYHFRSEEEFLKLVDYNGFIEYAQYVDHYYGTPRKFVEEELALGHTVILEIEVQGAVRIKEQYPEAVLIFITASSAQVLKDRLASRGTEDAQVIAKRIRQAAREAESIPEYGYVVCNEEGHLEDCVRQVHSIIDAESCRLGRNEEFVKQIKEELISHI